MDNYKKASRLKLRFETSKGTLSVEQLWDLSKDDLANIVRNLKDGLNKDSDDELSFLDETKTQVDEINQLQFDIVKEVYMTKKAELDEVKSEAENKIHNHRILGLIKKKKDSELEDKSVEDLESMLK